MRENCHLHRVEISYIDREDHINARKIFGDTELKAGYSRYVEGKLKVKLSV
jgi:hypothetical protein